MAVQWLSLEGMVADSVSIYSCVNCAYLACKSGHAPNLGSRIFRKQKFTRPNAPKFKLGCGFIFVPSLFVKIIKVYGSTLGQSSFSFMYEGVPSKQALKKDGCSSSHFRQKWQYSG